MIDPTSTWAFGGGGGVKPIPTVIRMDCFLSLPVSRQYTFQ